MPVKRPNPSELEPVETASRDELMTLQLERLKWSLAHAYEHVPHYRRKFDAARVAPGDLKSLADIVKFPFTTKQDLRDNYPFAMFAVPREQVVRIHASSGTTGRPTVVGYTARDIDTWSTVMARSIRAAGGRAGDIIHIAYGYGLFTGGLGAHYGAERLGCTVVRIESEGKGARQRVVVRQDAVAVRSRADELYDKMVVEGESFWSAVHPLFTARDMTRDDMRAIITRGLTQTRGSYRLVLQLFNMPAEDYKAFLNFLRKHQCHVPFFQFRCLPTPAARGEATSTQARLG
jgi:hypothetical protein